MNKLRSSALMTYLNYISLNLNVHKVDIVRKKFINMDIGNKIITRDEKN